MDDKNFGQLNAQSVLDNMKKELAKAKSELRQEGQDAGEAVGDGWDTGFDATVEKIKASSIKTEKAFSKLSEKIRKQVQQLSTNLNGKNVKLKIDFSDIDINSDVIKEKVNKIVESFSTQGLIEFDAKGSEQQFKNLITLYVKYQEKLSSLQKVHPSLSSSKDIEVNLQQQLVLASKLKDIWVFLDKPSPINGYAKDLFDIQVQLEAVQKITKQTQGGDTKVVGNYSELAKVLNEIQSSLKVISDTFKNENNSMQAMAENGVTSFKSLSEAIVSVYINLSQVQSLVDSISKKDFNITNITQTGGESSSLQAMKQQMAIARETMEHLRQLYDQAGDTLQSLSSKGQLGLILEYSKQLQELNLTEIDKSIKGANTEMKLAGVLAEMQDYIDKLTKINELRNQYGLGEWKDTFVSKQKPIIKPTVQQKPQEVTNPTVIKTQEANISSIAESQQMWQLKAAIDEVSNAIGRKNAGFIKEQEIVNTSVEAEKAKLKELIGVLTTDIGNVLEGLKEKFAQAFVMPELNKNALQTSFDEIYNKFIELKEKIGSSQIDFGINTAVKVIPVIDTQKSKTTDNNSIINSATDIQQSVNGESQSAVDAAKSFIEAANAKKSFVEANKNVAESAQSSESAVKKEAEAAKKVAVDVGNTASKVSKDLAKTKDVFNNDGELIQTDTTRKFKTNKAVVSETDSTKITTDADGQEIRTTITTIVKDFEKFNQEEKKTEEAIARAQSKLDEFIKKFKSKTGGNAQFIEGFSELENFTITKDNIEEAFNKITQLQARYNELEGNFRKGQSSLNPFTNAITKASNIDNIFGDVEFKFNSLNNKSDELVDKFTRLQEVSKKIKGFIELINTNPNSITSDQFTEFSKDVGEFNLLKTQVEGSIKREKRAENDDVKKQVEAYQEILRLIKERNKALITAEKADNGSIQQRNALTDSYQIEQKLHTLGQQIVLTDKQRAELAQIREEHARRIRDIEADAATKSKNQKLSAIEKNRAKEVENYINLIKRKNDYEIKAAKGGAMQSFYNEKVDEIKEQIANNDKQAIMNQEEKNRLVAIEEEHQRKIAELKAKQDSLKGFQKQNDTLQKKFDAGYLSQDKFDNWKNELAEYQSYLDGTVVADEATIQKKKEALTQLYDQLNKMSNASKTFFAKGGEVLPVKFDSEQIKNAGQSLRELYNNLSTERFDGMKTAVTGVKEELGRLTFTVDDGKGSLSSYMIQLDSATGATKLFKVQTQDTLTSFKQFATALKGDIKGMFSAFIGGVSGLYAAGRYIKEGIEFVKELDSALTELKKVTDETEETYDKFLDTAAKTGARIGSTLSNMTSATAEFAKLG